MASATYQQPFGVSTLKLGKVEGTKIGCHVKGCLSQVELPTKENPFPEGSLCPNHGIYIHRNTYRYKDWHRNLLRADDDRIEWYACNKREGSGERMGNENSEDAVTYNVFSMFQQTGKVAALLPLLTKGSLSDDAEPNVYLWTLEHPKGVWQQFTEASIAIGETPRKGTEPDVMLHAPERALVFVEAKFGSGNTVPSTHAKTYKDSSWFKRSMTDFPEHYYELARNWMVGTHLADQIIKVPEFWLVSLVRQGGRVERDIVGEFFTKYCCPSPKWHFAKGHLGRTGEGGCKRGWTSGVAVTALSDRPKPPLDEEPARSTVDVEESTERGKAPYRPSSHLTNSGCRSIPLGITPQQSTSARTPVRSSKGCFAQDADALCYRLAYLRARLPRRCLA